MIPDPRQTTLDALAVIDRHTQDGAHNDHAVVEAAYRTLAAAMDELYGPLPPLEDHRLNVVRP